MTAGSFCLEQLGNVGFYDHPFRPQTCQLKAIFVYLLTAIQKFPLLGSGPSSEITLERAKGDRWGKTPVTGYLHILPAFNLPDIQKRRQRWVVCTLGTPI